MIRSDQKSLKKLLQQVIQTPDQQFYVRKLMGYKFHIEYKIGASNRVADTPSHREDDCRDVEETLSLLVAVSQPLPDIMEVLRADVQSIPELIELRTKIEVGS